MFIYSFKMYLWSFYLSKKWDTNLKAPLFPALEDHVCSLWKIKYSVMTHWVQHKSIQIALRTQDENDLMCLSSEKASEELIFTSVLTNK